MEKLIYKIVDQEYWNTETADGFFDGAPVDLNDGFIHFSTAAQLRETAQKHFKDQPNLLLVAVEANKLGERLRYEASRNNDLFPHLYGSLKIDAVAWTREFLCTNCEPGHTPCMCTDLPA